MEASSVSEPFRLLDLPLEVRKIIYAHYYSACDLLLEYFHSYRQPETFESGVSWVRILTPDGNRVDRALHQMSKQVALEATPIWHKRSTHLTVHCEHNPWMTFDNLLPRHVCGDLASRLTTLSLVSTGPSSPGLDLAYLLRDCSELRNVDVIFKEHSYVNPEVEVITGEMWLEMCMTPPADDDEYYATFFGDSKFEDFAQVLLERHGKDFRVTSTTYLTGHGWVDYFCEERASGEPCLGKCHQRQMQYEFKIKFNVDPDQIRLVEKAYRSSSGLRAWWIDGMDNAKVVSADGEEGVDKVVDQ